MKKLVFICLMIVFLLTMAFTTWHFVKQKQTAAHFREIQEYRAEHSLPVVDYTEVLEKGMPEQTDIAVYLTDQLAAVSASMIIDLIESPVRITYYADPEDKEPAYVIEKGERISFSGGHVFLKSDPQLYGKNSSPSMNKGWRIVQPFQVEGKKAEEGLYYVRLSDYVKVMREWTDVNSRKTINYSRDVMSLGMLPTEKNLVTWMLLFFDRILLDNGAFLSADLLGPMLPPLSVAGIVISCVLSGLYLFLKKREKTVRRSAGKGISR